MESIGQLAAGIAPEINTPLQYVNDNTNFLMDSFEALNSYVTEIEKKVETNGVDLSLFIKDKHKEIDADFLLEEIPLAIDQTLKGIDHVRKIVLSMKNFTHPGVTEKAVRNLNESIEVTANITVNQWKYVADLETDLDKNLPDVYCDIEEINQVFLNLIVNAAHAIEEKLDENTREKGLIKITSKKLDSKKIQIEFADSGKGIKKENKDKIFDPFFTTKEVGKGTGQGLAISHDIIVNKHKGEFFAESEVNVGTKFVIILPVNEN